jgi:hypothetical protein
MGERWLKADLFFLDNALRHGMSADLGKTSRRVREKAQQLDLIADEAPVAPRE